MTNGYLLLLTIAVIIRVIFVRLIAIFFSLSLTVSPLITGCCIGLRSSRLSGRSCLCSRSSCVGIRTSSLRSGSGGLSI